MDTIKELWKNYKEKHTNGLRNELIELYFPFVKKIAIKLSGKLERHCTVEELTSLGLDGLYDAIEKFDITLGVKFESYSQRRIRGSMIDWLRKNDVVPRSVRINNNRFDNKKQELQNIEQRKVDDAEVATFFQLEKEFAKKRKKFRPIIFNSLESFTTKEEIKDEFNVNLIDHEVLDPDIQLRRLEFFTKLMGSFSKLEKLIIYLYYYRAWTMDKVAEYVRLSESRVSQMHKEMLSKLRDKIERNPDFFDEDVFDYIGSSDSKELF